MYLHSLSKPLEATLVGGKASSLSNLISYGFSVPNGYVISKELVSVYNDKGALPIDFKESLKACLSELNSDQIIVRSSAIGEDSSNHSFAGQLDSFVVNNDYDLVIQAIFRCWDGLKNNRLIVYQEISGKTLTEMGVVIQEFLDADYAGVTFTRSPYDENEIYTEYIIGAGEQLVSGKVTPLNFSVNIKTPKIELLPFNSRELIEKSLLLKDYYGFALDIEWVAKNQEIYFVQARPITVKQVSKVHWTNTNLNENYPDPISPLLYSIARDSYYHYFKNLAGLLRLNPGTIRSLEYDFSNTVGIWGNRIYYNMTSIHNILSSSPLKVYFKDAFNKFVGYSNTDVANSDTSNTTSLLKLILNLIRLNFRLEKRVQTIEKLVSHYTIRVLNAKEYSHYKDLYYEFLDLRFHQWHHASLADFFSMIHYKLLGRFTQKFYGEKSVGMHNLLVQAIPGLISSQPLNDTYDIALKINEKEGARDYFLNNNSKIVYKELLENKEWESINALIQKYLQNWGFRCSGELMFFKKNYIEEPSQFIDLLQSYLRHEAQDPRKVIALKDGDRKKAMKRFAWKIIKKRHILFPWSMMEVGQLYFGAHLCKQAIASRERVRYKQAEMYYRFKEVVKKIGEHAVDNAIIKNKDDVFYLKYKEIGELIASSDQFTNTVQDLIKQRKQEFRKESNKIFPEHFDTNFGERPELVHPKVSFQKGATEFSGLAASGGRIKARVKLLDSVLESEKLKKGDILVTKQTDPGWAMVFPLISGLIVEHGGALSHGAIVAREFGIPAVIGISNITKLLKDNDEVILDGDLGIIQLVK